MKRNTGLSVISVLWFCLVFLSACISNAASAGREKVFQCLALNPKREYIFYQVVTPANDNEIWAFDMTGRRSVLLPEEISSVQMTTPPGKDWLVPGNNSINFLDLDTCEIRPVYRMERDQKYFNPSWLRKDLILIHTFEDWPFAPNLYILDLKTNTAEKAASEKVVQAVTTRYATWIQTDGSTVESVQWQGSTRRILDDFDVAVDLSPGSIQFLPGSDEFIFVASRKGSTDFKIWKSDLRQAKPQIIFEPKQDVPLRYYQLSTDGNYLGLIVDAVVDSSYGYSFLFLNLRTNQVDFEWHYPPTRTNPNFIWSPNSKFVAIPFEGNQESTSFASHMGIQILEIETGKYDTLMDSGVTWLLGWYSAR